LGVGRGINNSSPQKAACYKILHRASDLDKFFGTTQVTENGYKFGTWKVRSLYRTGSVSTVARELARYKSDLVAVKGIGGLGWQWANRLLYIFYETGTLIITYG
jgi:hypothetical protein